MLGLGLRTPRYGERGKRPTGVEPSIRRPALDQCVTVRRPTNSDTRVSSIHENPRVLGTASGVGGNGMDASEFYLEQAAYCAYLLRRLMDPVRRRLLERERQDWLMLAERYGLWSEMLLREKSAASR